MRANRTGWLSPLNEPGVEAAINMMEALWKGNKRHGVPERPVIVSQEEAETAVQLAVTLVRWFTSGGIVRVQIDLGRRITSGGTPDTVRSTGLRPPTSRRIVLLRRIVNCCQAYASIASHRPLGRRQHPVTKGFYARRLRRCRT